MTEIFAFKGRLDQIGFPELVLAVSDRKETGVLQLSRAPIEKHVYFQDGRIVFARSNDPDERLGTLFLRRNKISYRQFSDAAQKVVPGKRLGTILVLDGLITSADLYQGVIDQIKEIIYEIFQWEVGAYEFFPGTLPSDEVITLNLSTPDLLLSGLSRIWRWSWVKKGSVSLDAVFRKKDGWSVRARRMTMTAEVQELLDLLDRPRTLEEILQNSKQNNFEACRLMWGLQLLGMAEQILAAPVWSAQSLEEKEEVKTLKLPTPASPQEAEQVVQPSSRVSNEAAVEQIPPTDLSFSDLADFTDIAEHLSPPADLESQDWAKHLPRDMKLFNEQHRYLFEILRLEIGPGVNRFLSKVLKKAIAKYPLVFDGVALNDFGEFDESSLTANIQGNLVEKYEEAFRSLLQDEMVNMRDFMDKKRTASLEHGLARLVEKQKAAY